MTPASLSSIKTLVTCLNFLFLEQFLKNITSTQHNKRHSFEFLEKNQNINLKMHSHERTNPKK